MSATTGTPMYNLNVLNIVDTQNTANSASGINVSDAVDQITQMVNFANKQINADIISAFTPGGSINVISPLNINDGTGITVLSNTNTGTNYDLFIYGNVYASNYQSLCPLKFTVGHENPLQVMQLTEEGHVGIMTLDPKANLDCAGTAIFRGVTAFNDAVSFSDCVSFSDSVSFDGPVSFSSHVSFSNPVSFKGPVTFEGDVIIKGRLIVED